VLQGALVFTAWQSSPTRPSRDIDLLGYMENTVEQVVAAVRAICQELAPDDGLRFDLDSIAGERIVEAAQQRMRACAYAPWPARLAAHTAAALVKTLPKQRCPTVGGASTTSGTGLGRHGIGLCT
jgi:hypothetical protein